MAFHLCVAEYGGSVAAGRGVVVPQLRIVLFPGSHVPATALKSRGWRNQAAAGLVDFVGGDVQPVTAVNTTE